MVRLGIDIDGVVSDSYTYWLGELNKHYGKDIKELYDYQIHLIFDVPWEDMNQFFLQNYERLFTAPEPMPGVKKALELLGQRHEIYLITARREKEEEITRRWLNMHGIAFDELMLVGDRSKAEVCSQHGIDLFIEDYHVNARLIADLGLPVIIFDAPYNRVELPQGVIRCYNWGQILKAIENRQQVHK